MKRPGLVLFFGLWAIYNSNLRPTGSGDTLPGSLIPLSLVFDHTVRLDRFGPSIPEAARYSVQYTDGHWYSAFPIAGPVLISPLYLPLAAWRGILSWPPEMQMLLAKVLGKLAASAVAALSAVFLFQLLRRITSRGWAWVLALLYALATETWAISSQGLWQHTFGQLGIAGALLFLDRWRSEADRAKSEPWLWALGAATAFSLMARPSNIVLLPAVMIGMLAAKARLGQLARVAILPLLGGAATAAYNFQVFRGPMGLYDSQVKLLLEPPLMKGAVGMLFSPGRGLLIFTPLVLFAVVAFLPAARASRVSHRPLLYTAGVVVILHSLIIGNHPYWQGGHCWGPRYLTEIMPPLVILIAIGVPALGAGHLKYAFVALALYSFLIQALGAYFYPHGLWDATPVNVDLAPGRVWDWKDNPILRTAKGGPVTRPYGLIGTLLREGKSGVVREIKALSVEGY